MKQIKPCKVCKEDFETESNARVTCSDVCKDENKRLNKLKTPANEIGSQDLTSAPSVKIRNSFLLGALA